MVMGGAIRVGSGIGLRSPGRAGLDTSNLAVGLQRMVCLRLSQTNVAGGAYGQAMQQLYINTF